MIFNSYTFIIFFSIVLLIRYSALSWRTKKINLLVASYIFYAAWNPPFVILLWISTVVDWFAAKRIANGSNAHKRRFYLGISLCVNLGFLIFFKYANFLLDNFVWLLGTVNIHYAPLPLDIILPVGISFYTFQTLSYTLDIYKRKAMPSRSFLDFALYVTFFPQLVAGPIVRAVDFLDQCTNQKKAVPSEIVWGYTLVLIGLFTKIVIADGLMAPVVEALYEVPGTPGFTSAWIGTLAFAGQIFADFSGYSTCAIGAALCLGFNLKENFRFPYASIGFSDFWKRWHISLSEWLRDYLYISMGGSRKGRVRTLINLMATMFLGGLWHGASWTFILWGVIHGFYLVVENIARGLFSHQAIWSNYIVRIALALLTFILVCFAWVFFRANTFDQALGVLSAMVGINYATPSIFIKNYNIVLTLLVMGSMMAFHWIMRNRTIKEVADKTPWVLRSILIAGMLVAIVVSSGENRAFIYFQF